MTRHYRLIAVLLAVFCAAGQEVRFSTDTVLTSDLIIPEGAVYTVEPGVSVLFNGYFRIAVEGLLVALGKPGEEIQFGCIRRVRGSEGPPCWQGMEILGENAGAVFRHCRFEGAYRIYLTAPEPEFDSCEFVGNHYAVYCAAGSKAAVRNCIIKRNGYGIVSDFSSPIILDNVIVENTVGLSIQHGSKALVGRNLIEQNQVNIRTDETLGKNEGSMTVKEIWDMMRTLY